MLHGGKYRYNIKLTKKEHDVHIGLWNSDISIANYSPVTKNTKPHIYMDHYLETKWYTKYCLLSNKSTCDDYLAVVLYFYYYTVIYFTLS